MPQVRLNQMMPWIALSIGNTHWKWGYFHGNQLLKTYQSKAIQISPKESTEWFSYCQASAICRVHEEQVGTAFPPLYLSSVVPSHTNMWQHYPNLHPVQLSDVPLKDTYPTLGIDRALALFGAGVYYGWPMLVIDAGTAITFSGANDQQEFQGGAIAPGLGLQLSSLKQNTGELPLVSRIDKRPSRWAKDTHRAILSGVLHGLTANITEFCRDWNQAFPSSQIIFTGGDGERLLHLCKNQNRDQGSTPNFQGSHFDEHLIFKGICSLIYKQP